MESRVADLICAIGGTAGVEQDAEAVGVPIARGVEEWRPFVVLVGCVPAFLAHEKAANVRVACLRREMDGGRCAMTVLGVSPGAGGRIRSPASA